MLPLLALRSADVSASLPSSRIRIEIDFDPATESVTLSIGSRPREKKMQTAALALLAWIEKGIAPFLQGKPKDISKDEFRWTDVTWKTFNKIVASQICQKVNHRTSQPSALDADRIPYIVSGFRQELLDDETGKQRLTLQFAIYKDLLDKWVLKKNS